jgi:hypothetical protein
VLSGVEKVIPGYCRRDFPYNGYTIDMKCDVNGVFRENNKLKLLIEVKYLNEKIDFRYAEKEVGFPVVIIQDSVNKSNTTTTRNARRQIRIFNEIINNTPFTQTAVNDLGKEKDKKSLFSSFRQFDSILSSYWKDCLEDKNNQSNAISNLIIPILISNFKSDIKYALHIHAIKDEKHYLIPKSLDGSDWGNPCAAINREMCVFIVNTTFVEEFFKLLFGILKRNEDKIFC